VLVDRRVPGLQANFVGSKDVEIGALATTHLIEQGCRHIAHLSGPVHSSALGRRRGYRQTLDRYDIEYQGAYELHAGHDDVGGFEAMNRLLKLSPRPDGVFCFNDPVAVGAMRAIIKAGLKIPQDIALIGAANMRYSEMLAVPLSTVDQATTAMGQQAARLLLDGMTAKRAPCARQILMSPTLVARVSSLRAAVTID
jgi:LacI family transcriptional regulator